MKRTRCEPPCIHSAYCLPACRTVILFLLLVLGGAILTLHAGQPSRQRPLSLDEINDRLSSLQGAADSLARVLSTLRQDSIRLKQESSQLSSALVKRQSEIDELMARKKEALSGLRSLYEKARQDSIAVLTQSRGQTAELRREIVRIESSIITLSNELEVLSARRDQIDRPSAGAEGKTIARLQAQIARNDSMIKARQTAQSDLSVRREKLRKDSLQEESGINAARLQFHDQIVAIDNEISKAAAALTAAEQDRSGVKSDKEKKIAEIRAAITALSARKRGYTDQIRRTETDVTALTTEKQRLSRSAGAARKKHEQLRAPLEQALEDAEAALKRAQTEKALIKVLREKLRLDSTISKGRDALDEAIQAEASRKKGSKKLVEQRENELNEYLNRLDALISKNPGLREIEAQFRAPTLSQKTGKVSDAVILADKPVATATAARDAAKQAIDNFDKSNPPPADPSGARIAVIDSALAVKKKAIIQMTEQIDSIAMASTELQTALGPLTNSLAAESSRGDSLAAAKKAEKTSLAAKKTKLVRDSIQNETANAGAINRIKTELSAVSGKLILAQNDVATFTAERDKAKESLVAAQDQAGQAQVSKKAERQKIDSMIAAKQQEITLVSMKCEKLRQDSVTLTKRETQKLQSLSTPPATFVTQIAAAEKEIANLQAQSDGLKKESPSAGARPDEEGRKLSTNMAGVARSIQATQREIAAMEKAKEDAYARLKDDQGRYANLIAATEQDLASAVSRRDKARQDSADAESAARQASQKMAADIREQESIADARQREMDEATAGWTRSRDDSIKISEKVAGALENLSRAVRSVDALITVKEKEIAELKARRDKARQDSSAEHKRLSESLVAAHNEIVKQSAAVSRKKTDATLAASNRKKLQADTLAYKQKAKADLAAAIAEIERQSALIEKKKSDMARLQRERDEISAHTGTPARTGTITVTDTKPASPAPTFSPASAPSAPAPQPAPNVQAPTPAEIAQLRSEELYAMLGENKVNEAAKQFRQLQGFLKKNLDNEAFQTLKVTIEQMGGSVR